MARLFYFPLQIYRVDRSHERFVMPLHWHSEFEIIKIKKGSFVLHADNAAFTLSEGQTAFLSGGTLHRGEPDGEDCVYDCAVFDLDMLRRKSGGSDVFREVISGTKCVAVTPAPSKELERLAKKLFRDEDSPYRALEVYECLFGLFFHLCSEGAVYDDPKARVISSKLITVLDYIDLHFAEHISLSELASLGGLNEKYFCKVFKEHTGKTAVDYINYVRVQNAALLLSRRRCSVTDAALDCGFGDSGYFCRVFKKYKGISPKEYAKRSGNLM